jgi:hypothetical protein
MTAGQSRRHEGVEKEIVKGEEKRKRKGEKG